MSSPMLVLVDGLGELPRYALVRFFRLLARRQPGLRVLAVGATTKAHDDAASM